MIHNVSRETFDASQEAKVIRLCNDVGLEIAVDQSRLMLRHLKLVLEANRTTNLTSIRNFEDALYLHLQDSAIFARYAPTHEHHFYDLGSGGGFPGISYGIITGMPGVLIDSVGKKVELLDSFINKLDLGGTIQTKHVRAEAFEVDSSARSVVLARAITSLPSLLELASPYLSAGDILVSSKGRISDSEIAAGKKSADIVGLTCIEQEVLSLSNDYGMRTVLVYEKTHDPEISLPRGIGRAQKRPLA